MEANDKKQVKTIKKVYPQIYSYELVDVHDHEGWQKVGYTERKDVDERIREQTQTAAIKLNYRKLWSASSVFTSDHSQFFTDKDLHKYYVKNNIARSQKQDDGGFGEEWFYFDGTPEKSKQLFDEYAARDYSRQTIGKTYYVLREEQNKAVNDTLAYAAEHQTTDFDNPNSRAKYLWNAKPRFGKTLTSYDFAKKFNAKNVLIVTNRPAIANSWYDDFEKFIDGYYFISTTDSLKERPSLSREEFLHRANPSDNDRQITFLSLQDLKGGKIFGGGYDKLEWVANLNWDLLIVDEAHEGVDTERTDEAFKKIKRRFTLHLSGTPFKAIADGYFTDKQIFNWTYIDEQKAKMHEIAEEAATFVAPKDEIVDKIVEDYMHQVEEPFAAYKEIYSPTNNELEELKNEHIEKVKAIAEEFVSKDISSAEAQNTLADKLSDLVQTELPNDLVVHKEVEAYEDEEESEMDQIRKKLRTFTRAIPSFVMACDDVNSITLDNIYHDTILNTTNLLE